MPKLPVVLAIDRAGIVGNDGETHHGVFDLSFLSQFPNMSILSPKNFEELRYMLKFAVEYNGGPVAIRYPRGQEKEIIVDRFEPIQYGKAELLQHGGDITIAACGKMVHTATKIAKELLKSGINAEVINTRFVKPLDENMILASAKKTKNVVTIEDNILSGGFGSAVLQLINNNEMKDVSVKMFGYPDKFINQGSMDEIEKLYGLDYQSITDNILKEFKPNEKVITIRKLQS